MNFKVIEVLGPPEIELSKRLNLFCTQVKINRIIFITQSSYVVTQSSGDNPHTIITICYE
jgi:hypothetical protein